jgi:glutathione S-transferase kappa 1
VCILERLSSLDAQKAKMSSVELFFDVVSPYSYICFEVLLGLQEAWDFELILTPASLGTVLQASGNKPPGTNPLKGKYLLQDIVRSAKLYEIEFKPAKKFPTNTSVCMRCLLWIQETCPENLVPAARAFWKQYYGAEQDIADPEVIEKVMDSVLSAEHKSTWNEVIKSPQVKEKFEQNTQKAIDSGAFGFPWMLVKASPESTTEALFGSDRFPHLAMMLGKPCPALPTMSSDEKKIN